MVNRERVDIREFKRIVFVYNRNSGKQIIGSRRASVEELIRLFRNRYPSDKLRFWVVEKFSELETIATQIVAEQAEWVVIAAGDGTIRSLVEQVVNRGHRPYFSFFPAGTVNLVAKELQISERPAEWMKCVDKGLVHSVYFARANGNLFLTVAGIGFDSLIVKAVTETSKKYMNKLAYVWQGFQMVFREMLLQDWRFKFQVSLDDGPWQGASTILACKSKYYAGHYRLFDNSSLGDDYFHVALLHGCSSKDFFRYSVCIGSGDIKKDKTVDITSARKIEIQCNVDDFPVELDGDVVTVAPLKIFMDEEPLKFLA